MSEIQFPAAEHIRLPAIGERRPRQEKRAPSRQSRFSDEASDREAPRDVRSEIQSSSAANEDQTFPEAQKTIDVLA